MENINQVTSNLSDMDKRFIKTEGTVPEDYQEGVSTGVWPILDEEQHERPFDLDPGQQQQRMIKTKKIHQMQTERNYASPQQEALGAKIAELQGQLLELYERQNSGSMTDYDVVELDRVSKELKTAKAQLKRKRQNQATQARARERKRKLFESLDPDTRVKVFGRKDLKIGRPSLCDNEELKKAILEITSQAAINDGRKSDTIRTAISLNQITAELQKRGFNLKRSAVYTRLLPRKASTHEGKRHNNIVPVKLVGTPTNRGSQQNVSTASQSKKNAGQTSAQSASQPIPSGIIPYSQGQVHVQQTSLGQIDNAEHQLAAFNDQTVTTTIYQTPQDLLKRQPATIHIQAPTIWTTQNVSDIQTTSEGVGETVTIFTTGSVEEAEDGIPARIENSDGQVTEVTVPDGLSSERRESEESDSNIPYSTPKQDALVARIAYLQDQETSYLLTGLTPGMLSENDARDLQRISKELQTLKTQLRKKQGDQKRQAKAREKKKKLLEKLDPETMLKVFGKLDVGQKKIRKTRNEITSPNKNQNVTENTKMKSPTRGSRRLGSRKKRRAKEKVPVPAYLYSTFDKETKAYFTPKEEPQSPLINNQEIYNEDLYDCEDKNSIKDDIVITEHLLQTEVDMNVLDGLGNAEPSEELIKTIVQIAIQGAENKQKSEVVSKVTNLEELAITLQNEKLQLHTTGSNVYRLLPKNGLTEDGKRCLESSNSDMNFKSSTVIHPDTSFSNATMGYLEELASILGPREVSFHSQNNLYRVPIGLALPNSDQSPLLMHIEKTENILDNEDYIYPPAHKLILSITGAMEIKQNCLTTAQSRLAIENVGSNYIAIRSAESQPPVIFQRLRDMKLIRQLQEFQSSVNSDEGLPKPVMIMTIKGSPEDNPRYSRTISCAIDYFLTFDLDALYISTSPSESQINANIHKRVVPIAKDLASVILPYEHFGQHYDGNNDTIDEDLEKSNYEKAGKVLSEMLSDIVIDGCPTVAEFVVPDEDATENDSNDLITKDEEWRSKHIRESQYLLQICKCDDVKCCSEKRSSLFRVIKDGFLPPPISVKQTTNGLSYSDEYVLTSSSIDDENMASGQYLSLFQNLSMGEAMLPTMTHEKFPHEIPYDFSCPSMKTRLHSKTCDECGRYFGSKSNFDLHYYYIHGQGMGVDHVQKNSMIPKQNSELINPERILIRKGGEILCLVKTSVNTDEYDWYRDNEVDDTLLNIECVSEPLVKSGIKLYTETERSYIWSEW